MMQKPRLIIGIAYYVAVVTAIVAALMLVVAFTLRSAGAADLCERHRMVKVFTHGGRSWRCRHVHHQVALRRFRPRTHKATTNADAPPIEHQAIELKRVRTIPITTAITPRERIERAFDRFGIMPIEDEP